MGRSKDLATLKSGLSIDGTLTTTSTGTNLTSNSYNVVKIQTDKDDNGSNDDAILQFTTGSSNTVKGELRYDESESKFEIGHGDNQGHISIDSSGRVTKPNQPSFYAYRASSNYTTTASGFQKALLTGTRWNTGSHFDTTNNRFTAPIEGVYHFDGGVNRYYMPVGTFFRVALYVNGSLYIFGHVDYVSTTSDLKYCVSSTIKLNANDYVELWSYTNTTTSNGFSNGETWNTLSGFLVG